jgi:hypothetical protein
MEHCWNDIERTKPKSLFADKYTLVPENTQNYHEIYFVALPICTESAAIKEMYVNSERTSGYNQKSLMQYFVFFHYIYFVYLNSVKGSFPHTGHEGMR